MNIANDPPPGHYQIRLVKRGPFVPVRIWIEDGDRDEFGNLESDQIIKAAADGVEVDVWSVWPYCAGETITASEYRFMRSRTEWDKRHAPDAPAANPRRPIDIDLTKPVF